MFHKSVKKTGLGRKRANPTTPATELRKTRRVFNFKFQTRKDSIIYSISITTSGGSAPAMNGGGGSSSASYSAVKEITSDENITSGEFSSSNADENAISVSGDITATLSGITITKTGDSDGGDNTSFYGTNSAIIAKGGANLTIKNANITTDATGANGVFSGAINSDNTGEVELTLDSSSSISLTGDTYVKSLTNADVTNSNIEMNGCKLYVDGSLLE